MKEFSFRGEIPASKSALIRALVLRDYDPGIRILGSSLCNDVVDTERALRNFRQGIRVLDCGEGGLVFRLLLSRVSRVAGEWMLRGSSKLLGRPHDSLFDALRDLGVEVSVGAGEVSLKSSGWHDPHRPIRVDAGVSSQFASAILLNAWDLEFPLMLELEGTRVSEGYWEMSLDMVRHFGMEVQEVGPGVFRVPADQRIHRAEFRAEADLSSAFAVASLAAVAGRAEIIQFPWKTRQPDRYFVDLLGQMGAGVREAGDSLFVERAPALRPIEVSLALSPDLFPVLSVLCALAKGRSRLFGAPHLRHKESDRIAETARLLAAMGREARALEDGIEIEGRPLANGERAFVFDPGQDHRLVMAAATARWAGYAVNVLNSDVVSKSFPEFLAIGALE